MPRTTAATEKTKGGAVVSAKHLGRSPHVRDQNSLGVQRLVMQTVAAVAVAARAYFVEEGAVHAVLKSNEVRTKAAGKVLQQHRYLLRAEDGSKTIGHDLSQISTSGDYFTICTAQFFPPLCSAAPTPALHAGASACFGAAPALMTP
jgi:hypothetical protein